MCRMVTVRCWVLSTTFEFKCAEWLLSGVDLPLRANVPNGSVVQRFADAWGQLLDLGGCPVNFLI